MSINSDNEAFLVALQNSLEKNDWVKLILSKYRGEEHELQKLTVRSICLRNETTLSFIYHYKTRDITKNLAPKEGVDRIRQYIEADFKSAHLLTETEETELAISKKGKVSVQTRALKNRTANQAGNAAAHDREKKRFVDINSEFLAALGVTDKQHKLIASMSRKWKQINKFVEIFSQAIELSSLPVDKPIDVVDFGSGKGYLTFAINDYLQKTLPDNPRVTGVELRTELVDLCNAAARKLELAGLNFVCGDIATHAPAQVDVMIALHACDTATDHAIHYGIRAGASIIMCSPCCHKQIRPQMHSPELLKPMLQYGVHLGQQAEMVTDAMRALLLEVNGYSTRVFEFVSLEHTNKNKMILAVKNKASSEHDDVLQQIAALKEFYGIKEHCLERLLLESSQQK